MSLTTSQFHTLVATVHGKLDTTHSVTHHHAHRVVVLRSAATRGLTVSGEEFAAAMAACGWIKTFRREERWQRTSTPTLSQAKAQAVLPGQGPSPDEDMQDWERELLGL